jgi:hypothetical protein
LPIFTSKLRGLSASVLQQKVGVLARQGGTLLLPELNAASVFCRFSIRRFFIAGTAVSTIPGRKLFSNNPKIGAPLTLRPEAGEDDGRESYQNAKIA